MFLRQDVIDTLKDGVSIVEFTKVNGERREMLCTLDPKFLPDGKDPGEEWNNRSKNLDVIPVWDFEKLAWRSFRVDSILSVVGAVLSGDLK